jgi:NADPH:quinone reductase-like Zn-dependent oxidoreductase
MKASMKAVVVKSYGGPDKLQVEEIPLPTPKTDEVLVRIVSSGVNPVDWKVVEGHFNHSLPFVPGWDFSGVVEQKGESVEKFSVGDEVFGRPDVTGQGTYAEYITVKENIIARKPASRSHDEVGGLALAGLTAWQSLFTFGLLEKGQIVFITGAAGGVGSFAVQLAKWKGAHIIATASKSNEQFVRELGASEVLDHNEAGYLSAVNPVDLVFDTYGGEQQRKLAGIVREGGRYISTVGIIDQLMFEEKNVHAQSMFAQSLPEDLDELARLSNDGTIRTIISKTFSLDEAKQAHIEGRKGHTRGKMIIKIAG